MANTRSKSHKKIRVVSSSAVGHMSRGALVPDMILPTGQMPQVQHVLPICRLSIMDLPKIIIANRATRSSLPRTGNTNDEALSSTKDRSPACLYMNRNKLTELCEGCCETQVAATLPDGLSGSDTGRIAPRMEFSIASISFVHPAQRKMGFILLLHLHDTRYSS